MSFSHLYRGSFYLMLFLATLVMSIDATTDNQIAMLYPPAVAVAGAIALLTVDRRTGQGISYGLSLGLSWGVSIILVYLEFQITQHLLLSLAHLLVYLQIIKMLMPKTVEDDWLLCALGLMQVLVGTVMSQSDEVGAALFGWALVSLWVLGLFYLQREAQRQRAARGVMVLPAPVPGVPYPGLFDPSFLFASVRVVAITLALGGLIFLAMPRRAAIGASRRAGFTAKHLTGFGEEVQLGQLGEILENDSVVMSIELFGGSGNRTGPPDEPLWRGTTMGRYENGRWHRIRLESKGFSSEPLLHTLPEQVLRQRIKLEPTDTKVLFGLRPMLDATRNGAAAPDFNPVDGSIHRSEVSTSSYDYDVYSSTDLARPQPLEDYPRQERFDLMLQVPEPLKTRLRAIARPLVAAIPASDVAGRARALEHYLRDSGGFGYTLQMDVTDPAIDPVEDFLVNRKQGHCAYFASALTLLLRSIDIPARMVNGFKGGDWNELANVMTVREKYAHTWVEALTGSVFQGSKIPLWITLDPTPSQERNLVVARVGGVSHSVRLFSDLIRYVWVFYIAGFDAERQDRLVYRPIRLLLSQARSGYEMILKAFMTGFGGLLHFTDLASFFSKRGFAVSFAALVLFAGVYRLVRWSVRRLLRWLRGPDRDPSALAAGVLFYRRLTLLLAEYGLVRPPAETPNEFARRATGFLIGRGPESEPVSDVPPEVVDAFYRVRFGHRTLTPDVLRHLEARLDLLESRLQV